MHTRFGALVAGFTAFCLLAAPAASSAAPPEPEVVVRMSTLERAVNIGAGVGLIAGGLLPTAVGGYVGSAAIYGGLAAIGITTAAPVIVGTVLVAAVGTGAYFLVKGLIGRKRISESEAAGLNVSRNAPTTPRGRTPGVGSPSAIGGAAGAGTPR